MTPVARAWAVAQHIAVAALPFVPVIGAAAVTAFGLQTRDRDEKTDAARWSLAIFGGYLAWFVPIAILAPSRGLLGPLGLAVVGTVGLWLLRAPRNAIVGGALIGLLVMISAASAERWLEPRRWAAWQPGAVQSIGVTPMGSTDRVVGHGAAPSAERRFQRPDDAQAGSPATLVFEIRAEAGPFGWDWIRSPDVVRVEPTPDGETTRIVMGASGDPYVLKRYTLPDGIARRRVVATVDLRRVDAPEGESDRCGRVYLAEPGARIRAVREVCVGPTWTTPTLDWRVPPEASGTELDLIVNDFDGATIEVAKVELRSLGDDGAFRPVTQPFPGGTRFRIFDGEELVSDVAFTPGATWTRVERIIDLPRPVDRVRVQLHADTGTALRIRNVSLSGWAPQAGSWRSDLWFESPNLLGHAAVTTAVLVATTAVTAGPILAGLTGGTAMVALTSSRAALVGLTVACVLLALATSGSWSRRRGPRAKRVRWGTALLAIVLVLALAYTAANGLDREGAVPRTQIWRTAVAALRDAPWSGLSGQHTSFVEHFASQRPDVDAPVRHGHNVWLDHAAKFGLSGLAASVWLTASLFVFASRKRGAFGIILVATVLAMNVLDTTLAFYGVLLPMLLGLNARRIPPSESGGESGRSVSARSPRPEA